MRELERALAETLREHAGGAPPDAGLLARVHRRSDRLHRRRQGLIASGGLLATAAAGALLLVAPWPGRPAAPSPAVVGPSTTTVATTTAPAITPPSTAAGSLRFVAGSLPALSLPLGLDPAIADGWDPAVVEVSGGAVQATYFPHDPDGDADLVLRRTPSRPPAPERAGAGASAVTVRGVGGQLYTVPDPGLRKLVLVWPEGGGWLSLQTDDTYSPARLRQFADGLTAQSLRPPNPVRFERIPLGLAPTRVIQSEVGFGPKLRIQVVGPQVPVSGGVVQRVGGTARVVVGFEDDERRLQVTVTPAGAVGDADLLVFAAGLRLTEDANPAP